jgi:predicted GNAT family N-acyltransferase
MRVIEEAARLAGVAELRLESQTHAIPFYERLGYAAEGPEYLDCGIPHRLMRLRLLAG